MITASLLIGAVYCLLFGLCLSEAQRASKMEEERDNEKRRADTLQRELERVCRSGNWFPIGLDMTVSTN